LVCEPGKLRAAAADRLLVGFKKTLPDKISERVADLIEAVNDRGRCAGWNEPSTDR
jgi:hypothetical protein